MSGIATIVEKAVEWAFRHFTALQVCWVCLASVLGLGWLVTARYAPAAEVAQLRDIVTELRAEAAAKRLFDYKVQLCQTPPEQRTQKRWLTEQLNEAASKFRKITGEPFNMPSCGDL